MKSSVGGLASQCMPSEGVEWDELGTTLFTDNNVAVYAEKLRCYETEESKGLPLSTAI